MFGVVLARMFVVCDLGLVLTWVWVRIWVWLVACVWFCLVAWVRVSVIGFGGLCWFGLFSVVVLVWLCWCGWVSAVGFGELG